jgi:hypothetical protein
MPHQEGQQPERVAQFASRIFPNGTIPFPAQKENPQDHI